MKFEIAWKVNSFDCRAQCTLTAPCEDLALTAAMAEFGFGLEDLIYIKKVD